jgi:hypothetical protein
MKKKDAEQDICPKCAAIKLAEEAFAGDSRKKASQEAALTKKLETDPVAFARFAIMLSKLWGKDYDQARSKLKAKMAAQFFELWGASDQVTLMGNRQFFIDLGKCLSGGMKTEVYSRLERDIAELVFSRPHLSAREAVRELSKRNHQITEEHFRVEKMRLLKVLCEIEAAAEQKLKALRESKSSGRAEKA